MPRASHRRRAKLHCGTIFASLLVSGCSSIGDYGRLQSTLISDDMHAWVGQEAAARVGAPISFYNLTEEERTLRDLAFPLIEPPFDRQRWDAVVYEYGSKREFQHDLWTIDPSAYYLRLLDAELRSTAGRYNKLTDDVRNDVVRIPIFFDVARRVLELDRRRQAALQQDHGLLPSERLNALARVGENNFTIAWVQQSLAHRSVGYRYALNRLAVAEPDRAAAVADVAIAQLDQLIAANQLVSPANFRFTPGLVATRNAPPVR